MKNPFNNIHWTLKNILQLFAAIVILIGLVAIMVYTETRRSAEPETVADPVEQYEELQSEPVNDSNMVTVVFSDYINRTFAFRYESSAYGSSVSNPDKNIRLYTYLSMREIAAVSPGNMDKDDFQIQVYNQLRIKCAEDSIIVTNFELTEIKQ